MSSIFSIFNKEKENKVAEGINEEYPLLNLEIDDDEIIFRVNKMVDMSEPYYRSNLERSVNNRKYWTGNQLDVDQMKDYQSKIVSNIIFRNLETTLPIITKNTPLPNVISSNKDFDGNIKKILEYRWEVLDGMLGKNRRVVRAGYLDLLGVLKVKWDNNIEDMSWEYVRTKNLRVDPNASDVDDVSFVIEYVEDYIKDVVEKFPKAKEKLFKNLGIKNEQDEKFGGKITYLECWTPEFVVWKYDDVLLDKAKNPNWDWGMEKEVDEKGEEKEKTYNFFKKPRVPYIFFSLFVLDNGLYSDTSLVEQTITNQDSVNKRKRQISDNADDANGILVGSGDVISREEFSKIEPNEPNLKVWLESGDANRGLARVPGNPLQPYVFNDLLHSERTIDDIWGIHAITRGVSEADTATQDVLQQKQDYGRIDDIVKAYEDLNEQYFQWVFQMMLIYYDEPHYFSFEEDDDLEIDKKALVDAYSKTIIQEVNPATGKKESKTKKGNFRPPIIMVKRGSTLPTDEVTRRAEAMNLAGAGRISTLDLYEKLGWPNPRESAKNLFLETNAPELLYPEIKEEGNNITEGAADDFERIIKNGQETSTNPEIADPEVGPAHLKAHELQLETNDFKGASPERQQEFINHLRSEIVDARSYMEKSSNLTQENALQNSQV